MSVDRRFSLWFQGRCAGRTSDSTLADKALAGHEIACEVMKLTKELLASSFMTIMTIATSFNSSATAKIAIKIAKVMEVVDESMAENVIGGLVAD